MAITGVDEDRSREQFTADILYHPPGEGGHVYVAKVLAQLRANSLDELESLVHDVTFEADSQDPEKDPGLEADEKLLRKFGNEGPN